MRRSSFAFIVCVCVCTIWHHEAYAFKRKILETVVVRCAKGKCPSKMGFHIFSPKEVARLQKAGSVKPVRFRGKTGDPTFNLYRTPSSRLKKLPEKDFVRKSPDKHSRGFSVLEEIEFK